MQMLFFECVYLIFADSSSCCKICNNCFHCSAGYTTNLFLIIDGLKAQHIPAQRIALGKMGFVCNHPSSFPNAMRWAGDMLGFQPDFTIDINSLRETTKNCQVVVLPIVHFHFELLQKMQQLPICLIFPSLHQKMQAILQIHICHAAVYV